MRIHKFGGASVKDAASFRNLAAIVAGLPKDEPYVLVVSAMGKTTNALEEIFRLAYARQDYTKQLQLLTDYHFSTATELFVSPEHPVFRALQLLLDDLKEKLARFRTADFDCEYDQIIPFGELLSSTLLHYWLQFSGIENNLLDCRTCIRTDLNWREATVDWAETEELIRQQPHFAKNNHTPVVTQGFIGGTTTGLTSTLGREGSDYTAAIFAFCLNAASMTIWKDVPGLLNADPKLFKKTVKYEELSFQETIEMAYYGASVIHPKTIQPLSQKKIPLYVKSFANPEAAGTIIHDCRHEKIAPAIIVKQNQTLVSVEVKNLSFVTEHNLCDIFTLVSRVRLKLNVMQNSAVSFSFCFDYDEARFKTLMEELSAQYHVYYNHGLTLYTIKNYDEPTITRTLPEAEILLEQRTRTTFQAVCKL